ncbi:glycosyltransferase family 32 protein [Paenibacillus apii]|uniref:glycosyltransferase family 32 protein n=1 Tax=Paenibacillus apii TaxID=1850370 RepID=UPI00143C234D|nr:glycosyltransferase [Paenibacillus apii]NJJ41647.1 mannosyltransferase [Paenibacillus apii]
MSIPKIIHYCWFGGKEKPKSIQKCMNTWGNLKGYEIMEWNESNVNFELHPYLKRAYELKKYAFVSDYIRLKVLYEIGGIYLDTDIEIKKDLKEFEKHSFFIGFMFDSLLGTALIGSEKGSKVVEGLLKRYDSLEFKEEANNNLFTKYFLEEYNNFRLNNKYQMLEEGVVIYPKEFFERPTFQKTAGYTVHRYAASWQKKNKGKITIKKIIEFVLGEVLFKKLTHKKALSKTPFYSIYLEHKNE